MQKHPDTTAVVAPEGTAPDGNRIATHDRAKTAASPPPVSPGKIAGTILVIADIPAYIDFTCATLQSSGYKVVLAKSVNRAVALTEEVQPDAVLSDLHMRPLNGLDFLAIAKRTPALQGVPIVIISSTCTLERERCSCLEHGAARFVRRPIQPEALLGEIAEALTGSRP